MISSLELARLCGVSQGTVDRALHDRAGVSAATRRRVLQMAARHGHRPHPAVRELLAGGRRSTFVQAALPAANNLFFMDLAERLAEALRGRGLRLQIALVRDRADLLAVLEDAAARRHRIALFVPPEEGIAIPPSLVRDLPMASLLSPARNVPFLSPDEEATGRDGVDYLHGLGHREIAFLSSPRRAHAVAARAAGYRKRMGELGLRPRVVLTPDPAAWGRRRPTALFCHNDWLAAQALARLRAAGVAVPEAVSILGVDDNPTLSALCPGLTTLAYPVAELIAAILRLLDGKTGAPMRDARFPVVARNTVTPPRGTYPGRAAPTAPAKRPA